MMKKLVLTGAAGRLGSYLREPLSKMCEELVSTDIVGRDRHALSRRTLRQGGCRRL